MTTYDGSEELQALRGATAQLSEQVITLSEALKVVGGLQARQQELEDATGEMIERTGLDADANARSRRHLWRRGVPSVVLIALGLLGVFVVDNRRFERTCGIRNQQAIVTHSLLARVALSVPPGSYRDALMADLKAYEPVDCSLF